MKIEKYAKQIVPRKWRLTLKEEDANGREDDANPADSDWNEEDCEEQPGRTKFSLIANITRSALRRSSSTSSIYRRQLSLHCEFFNIPLNT